MLPRAEWEQFARKLDWDFSYVSEREVYPDDMSGVPWLAHEHWREWDEPYRISFGEYARTQDSKEDAVAAVCRALDEIRG